MKSFLKRILPLGLAGILLWYALKDSLLTDIADQFRRADYRWLLLVGGLVVAQHTVRAARWQLTLRALGFRPPLFRTTVALLAGTMAGMIVPGAGELTRCGTLQRTDGVPLAQGIGSVVAERIIDLLMLGVLIVLTLLLEFKRVGQYITDLLSPLLTRFAPNGQSGGLLLIVLLVGLTLLGLAYVLLRSRTLRQHRLVVRLLRIGRDVGRGFLGIRQLRQPGLFVGLTVLGHSLAFLTTYALFFAIPPTVSLPPTAALTILTVSSLGGLAVPTQGGIGTYHFLVSRVLMLYAMPEAESVAVATFLHAVQTGFSLLLSSLSFLIVPLLLRQKAKRIARTV